MTRRLLTSIIVGIVFLIVLIAPSAMAQKKGSIENRLEEIETKNRALKEELRLLRKQISDLLGLEEDTRVFSIPIGESPVQGKPEASIVLIEFGDMQSDYTARAQHVVRRLLREYPNALRFVFKHYPLTALHPQASEASLVALAAEKQDKGWEMHNQLLLNSRRLDASVFTMLAQQLGLNLTLFERDRRSLWALERLSNDEKLAQKIGVIGVPTFFLNGRRMKSWRYDYLKSQLDSLIGRN